MNAWQVRGVTTFSVGALAVYVAALGALLWVISACDEATVAGPSPPQVVSLPADHLPTPRVDAPFDWDHFQGFSAFAMGGPGQTEDDIRATFAEAMSHGWNTARRCAELEFWEGSYQYPRIERQPEALERFLDVVARIHGAQVLLVSNCTLKGPVPVAEQIAWAWTVAKVVAGWKCSSIGTCAPSGEPFENVAVEVVNEFDNCAGRGWGPHCPGKQDLRAMIDATRQAGVRYVTADDSICPGDSTYEFRLMNIGAWPPDFHYCREYKHEPFDPLRDPNDLSFLRKVIDANRGFVLFSEGVAFADFSGTCDGLRTCDMGRIQAHIDRCAAVSLEPGRKCKTLFHSEAGLIGAGYTAWPEAR